jgi:hypothetical protein
LLLSYKFRHAILMVTSDCLKLGLVLKIRFNFIWDLIKKATKITSTLTEHNFGH